jgi:choline dehydrogenase-like flavoprotein
MARWVVVGAGAGGCVAAGRLSADPHRDVVLVESGPDHGPADDPRDRGPYLVDPRRMTTVPARRVSGGRALPYRLGHGLGGSSLINGTIVVTDGPGTDSTHLLPIAPVGPLGPVGTALIAAEPRARPLGVIREHGRRVTAADAYIRPFLDRPNLRVRSETTVARIAFDGARAIGVVTVTGEEIRADRVVLCAGAIGTPALLLRSGVVVGGLGEHLQDHPAFVVTLEIDPSTADPDAFDITAAMTLEDRQVLGINRLDGRDDLGALMTALTRVTSRGSVTVDGDGRPVVEIGQLGTSGDVDRLAQAVAATLRLLEHPAMRRIVRSAAIDERGTPASRLVGDLDAIRAWLTERPDGYHHVAGTCRRGEVTDDDGWVRDHHDLAVCDASLFVEAPPTNLHLATIALAEQLAARWRRAS